MIVHGIYTCKLLQVRDSCYNSLFVYQEKYFNISFDSGIGREWCEITLLPEFHSTQK